MELFERIPQRLFSILTSSHKDIYSAALFVVRDVFRMELVIRKEELAGRIADALELRLYSADFGDEEMEEDARPESADTATAMGKAYFILRRFQRDGWIEEEQDSDSFDVNITIPDYSIKIINLLYDLTEEETREYNSYVYATYAALKNAGENEDYYYNALRTAYRNSEDLVNELKTLFNNIRRYQKRAEGMLDVNKLLKQLLVSYRQQIIDTVYYPLKTIDSVPRFKNPILTILALWNEDPDIQEKIVAQGMRSNVYKTEDEGHRDIIDKLNFIEDTFNTVEDLIASIDRKHNDYTNASIDRIRYMMNSDRSIKGKLIEILKRSQRPQIMEQMRDAAVAYAHSYYDEHSLYQRRADREPFKGNAIRQSDTEGRTEMEQDFLKAIRQQYSSKKIDGFIMDKL